MTSRSRLFLPRTAVSLFIIVLLFYNHIALIGQLSMSSVSIEDRITAVDLSILPSPKTESSISRDGSNSFDSTATETTTASTRSSPEITTNIWAEKLRNNSSSSSSSSPSRIGIHILRPGAATNIILLGERHSGTTFFTKFLQDCFSSTNVSVKDTFVNNKHWLQPDPDYLINNNNNNNNTVMTTSDFDSSLSPLLWRDTVENKGIKEYLKSQNKSNGRHHHSPNKFFKDSLVIVLFRNPYEW